MKISTLLFLFVLFICGLHGLSDAASIPTGRTEIGFNDVNLLSSISNLFQCNLLESDEIPSAIQISTNPIGSLRTAFCFTLERIIDTIKKIRNNNSLQSIEIIFDNILPTLKELLVNLSDSNILPPPSSYLIRNLLMLYDVSRLMRSTI